MKMQKLNSMNNGNTPIAFNNNGKHNESWISD